MATSTNSILEKVYQVFNQFSGKPFIGPISKDKLKDIKPLQSFFEISEQQSIILSVMIELGMRNQEITINTFIEHFDGRLVNINAINQTIQELVKKGLINSKTTGRFPNSITNQTFHLEEKILDALIQSNKTLLRKKLIKCLSDFLEEIKNEFQKREDGVKDGSSFVIRVGELITENSHLIEIKWLSNKEEWSSVDKLVFLSTAVSYMEGKKSIDLEYIIKQVIDSFAEQFSYRSTIVKRSNPMVVQGYIKYEEEEFIFDEYISLTQKSISELFGETTQTNTIKGFTPTMGHLIYPDTISDEKLFYNDSERKQIQTIATALKSEKYNNIITQLRDNNLGKGINILLHGYAGTGKTATVKQIAKQTNRVLFMIDIEKVQSKWVGDSEKNLKKVFNEYNELCNVLQETAILLFNEADAIIGKRVEIRTSTDKSFNTLQNILLQELEDFKGISFSTTNLASQLDKAFERRFLYKVKFEKPNREIQQQILTNSFANIKRETIAKAVSSYELTGGQISNIKKKLLLKSIVEEIENENDFFIQLCIDELSLENSLKTKPIGFNSNH